MTLREWLDKEELDVIAAANLFEVSVHAIKKWLRGDRIPRDKMKAKIKKLTKGAVNGDDWV